LELESDRQTEAEQLALSRQSNHIGDERQQCAKCHDDDADDHDHVNVGGVAACTAMTANAVDTDAATWPWSVAHLPSWMS
jgi:hypothetical protein